MARTCESDAEDREPTSATARPILLREHAAVLTILLPALGYAAAYLYRSGEVAFYGLPPELVSLDLKDAVVAGLGVGIALAVMIALMNFATDALEGVFPREHQSKAADIAVPATFVVVVTAMTADSRLAWLSTAVALFTIVFLQLGPALISQRRVKGLSAKLRAQRKAEADIKPTPLGRLMRRQRSLVLLGSAIYIVLYIASPAGEFSARTRTTFAVVESKPERVVVSEYHGSFIMLSLDLGAKAAGPPVTVSRPEDLDSGFSTKKIGPLTFASP